MIYIMRGLPGSGKTTWVDKHVKNAIVCSADKYHMINGVYKYDPKRAGMAHDSCLHDFLDACSGRNPNIVVDNTNTTLLELAPYVRIALALNLPYQIVYIVADPIEAFRLQAFRRGVHQVPINTILAMHRNLLTEIVPIHWNQSVVVAE